jgi:hypothetical protein
MSLQEQPGLVHRQPLTIARVGGADFEVLNPSIRDFEVCTKRLATKPAVVIQQSATGTRLPAHRFPALP